METHPAQPVVPATTGIPPSPSGWDSSAMCCASSLSAHRPAALAIGRWFIRVLSASRRFYMSSCRIAGRVNDRSASQWRVSSLMTDVTSLQVTISQSTVIVPTTTSHLLSTTRYNNIISQSYSTSNGIITHRYSTLLILRRVATSELHVVLAPILQLPIKNHQHSLTREAEPQPPTSYPYPSLILQPRPRRLCIV